MRIRARLIPIAAFLVASAASQAGSPPAQTPPATLSGPSPSASEQAALDARRHGPEIIAFAGLKRGDKIIEVLPSSGYWTRLFVKAVGPAGHIYGIWPTPLLSHAHEEFAAYNATAGHAPFANVSSSEQPPASLSAPEKVNLVFISQNYHDYPDKFMGPTDPMVLNRLVFDALKPGGTYLIIDHAAAAGAGRAANENLHRVDPATVKAEVTAAGFRFAGESRVLANPADDHSKLVFDPSIRGHTDQFIYKFRKPG